MNKFNSLLALLLLPFFYNYAQENKQQRITSFIENTLKTTEVVPSVSVVIVDNQGVLYQETFGYADLEKQLLVTKEHQYYIASVTKAYTGLLLHILASEGSIDLNEQIVNYKPFKNFSDNLIFKNITVLDLLTHQSGIDNPYLTFRLAYSGDYTQEEILRLIEEETKKNEDGKTFEYTNFGYYLLDYLLQAELGKSWKELLNEKVFQPLEMINTTASISEIPIEKLALPHRGVIQGEVKKASLLKSNEVMHAAGGLVSSIEDAGKLLTFYLDKGKDIYTKEMVEDTYQTQVAAKDSFIRLFEGTGYASGWRTGIFEKEQVVYHFGGYTGYFAHLSFIPKKNIGIAVFTNTDMGMTAANLIVKYAYNLYLNNHREVKEAEKILTKKVPKALSKQRKYHLKHQDKLSERTWNLSLPKEAYTGIFYNKNLGTIKISYENETLFIASGKLTTTATPFPNPDTMRVELIPGSGTIIGFNIKENKVISMYHQKESFERVE